MLDVLTRLDALEIKVLDILPAEDSEHCNKVFEKYVYYAQIITNTQDYLRRTVTEAKNSSLYDNDDRYGPLYDINESAEELTKTMQKANKGLIKDVRNHFKEKYHLSFDEYAYEPKRHDMTVFTTYQPFIDHMLKQVGTDLTAAGQTQIIDEFRSNFCKGYREPKLQGAKISFSNLLRFQAYTSNMEIAYDCKGTKSLFTALGLFLDQSNEMPQDLNDLFIQWQRTITLGENYTAHGITFKVFGNRRIDATFASKEQARQFWDFYNLNNIRQRDSW
jgi:hypothetical protein